MVLGRKGPYSKALSTRYQFAFGLPDKDLRNPMVWMITDLLPRDPHSYPQFYDSYRPTHDPPEPSSATPDIFIFESDRRASTVHSPYDSSSQCSPKGSETVTQDARGMFPSSARPNCWYITFKLYNLCLHSVFAGRFLRYRTNTN